MRKYYGNFHKIRKYFEHKSLVSIISIDWVMARNVLHVWIAFTHTRMRQRSKHVFRINNNKKFGKFSSIFKIGVVIFVYFRFIFKAGTIVEYALDTTNVFFRRGAAVYKNTHTLLCSSGSSISTRGADCEYTDRRIANLNTASNIIGRLFLFVHDLYNYLFLTFLIPQYSPFVHIQENFTINKSIRHRNKSNTFQMYFNDIQTTYVTHTTPKGIGLKILYEKFSRTKTQLSIHKTNCK